MAYMELSLSVSLCLDRLDQEYFCWGYCMHLNVEKMPGHDLPSRLPVSSFQDCHALLGLMLLSRHVLHLSSAMHLLHPQAGSYHIHWFLVQESKTICDKLLPLRDEFVFACSA